MSRDIPAGASEAVDPSAELHSGSGSGKRVYRSSLRQEQARATRWAIVDAAARLFVERGYSGTTIDAVAEAAGVSRKTVFTAVGGKPQLLKLARDWTLAGDDEPVAMADRPEFLALRQEREPVSLLHSYVQIVASISRRLAPIWSVMIAAADVDPGVALLHEEAQAQRRDGAHFFVEGMGRIGGINPAVGVQRAETLVWAIVEPTLYERLVLEGAWTDRDYAEWLEQTLAPALLPAGTTSRDSEQACGSR